MIQDFRGVSPDSTATLCGRAGIVLPAQAQPGLLPHSRDGHFHAHLFSPDGGGDVAPRARAARLLVSMRAGNLRRAPELKVATLRTSGKVPRISFDLTAARRGRIVPGVEISLLARLRKGYGASKSDGTSRANHRASVTRHEFPTRCHSSGRAESIPRSAADRAKSAVCPSLRKNCQNGGSRSPRSCHHRSKSRSRSG